MRVPAAVAPVWRSMGAGLRSEHMLRSYQCRAARIITEQPMCAGFIDMGLGKTAIGLTAVADIKEIVEVEKKRKRFKWLVIAPIKVCETVWRQEAKLWEHTEHLTFSLIRGDAKQRSYALCKEADIYLINPQLISWLQQHLRNDWSMFKGMIVDESSLFKDNRSKRFRALTNYASRTALKDEYGKAIRDKRGKIVPIPAHKFQRTVLFTGTPRPQSSMNLWSQIYILDHGIRLHPHFDTFRGRFFYTAGKVIKHVTRYEENDDAKPPEEGSYHIRDGAPERIHELIADISVELNAEEMGILPPIVPVYHYVELPTALQERYNILEKEALIELAGNPVIATNGGVKTMMCWQFANGAIYNAMVDAGGKRTWEAIHDELLNELDNVIELIDDNVIISYYFQHDLARILARHPDAVVLPKKAETVIADWNAGRIGKLLLHSQSGSHGLNLQQGGHNLIWFGAIWSNESYMQTNRRIARPGQPHPFVNAHHIMCKRTIHELQHASILEKGGDQARFRSALNKYQEAKQLGLYTHELYDYAKATNPLLRAVEDDELI